MRGEVRVGNKRAGGPEEFKPELGEVIIDIDRPNILSNPFTRGTRVSRIELFDDLITADIQQGGLMFQELERLAKLVLLGYDIILMCWCKPLPCHGDVVKREIDKIVDKLSLA